MTLTMNAGSHTTAAGATFSCLMVEDDLAFATMVAQIVREEGGVPTHCKTIAEARAVTAQRQFDLVLLDNHLPDGKAYDFFDQVSRRNPDAPIVMITGLPALNEAISLTRNGLFDYLTKPVDADALSDCLRRARLRLRHRGSGAETAECFGSSPAMRQFLDEVGKAARHPMATVLFSGESGAGKDIAARTLHRLTYGEKAAQAPYVAVNAAAVPADMFESELFGAERGAYTGADKKRQGLVSAAQGGTLFLDEIAEVPMALQAKLLRFLEGREFRPLGSTVNETFTGRFVAATNKSLRAEVQAGRFREDLLFRIEVFALEVPALRQRREDVPGLSEFLLAQLAKKYGRATPMIKGEDLAALQSYDFPGNVRELRNILERGLLRTGEEDRWLAVDAAWLKAASVSPRSPVAPGNAPSGSPNSAPVAAPALEDSLPPERAGLSPLESQEYRMIRTGLIDARGGIRRAASKLGLSPQALLRRLEKWPELRPPPSAD